MSLPFQYPSSPHAQTEYLTTLGTSESESSKGLQYFVVSFSCGPGPSRLVEVIACSLIDALGVVRAHYFTYRRQRTKPFIHAIYDGSFWYSVTQGKNTIDAGVLHESYSFTRITNAKPPPFPHQVERPIWARRAALCASQQIP